MGRKKNQFTDEELNNMKINNFKKGYRNVLTCLKCNDSIYSKTSGEYVTCSCESCFVDETSYYYRVGGNSEDYKTKMIRIEELDRSESD